MPLSSRCKALKRVPVPYTLNPKTLKEVVPKIRVVILACLNIRCRNITYNQKGLISLRTAQSGSRSDSGRRKALGFTCQAAAAEALKDMTGTEAPASKLLHCDRYILMLYRGHIGDV